MSTVLKMHPDLAEDPNWRWRKTKAWAFKIIAYGLIANVYLILISRGCEILMPDLAQKLHRLPIPFVNRLRDYQVWSMIALSHVFAFLLFCTVSYCLNRMMWIYFAPRDFFASSRFEPAKYTKFMTALTVALVGCDGTLFYAGLAQAGLFGGSLISIPAMLATIAYVAVLVCISFVAFSLEKT